MLMRENGKRGRKGQPGDVDSVLFKAIVDAVVDAIVVIDGHGRIRMANPATQQLFGYRLEELLDENVTILMPEPYHSEHDEYIDHYLKTGERRIIGIGREVTGRRKDGSTFPMYLSVAEVQYGDLRYFAGIIHDLSAQKNAEQALQESEQHLRLTLDNAPIGIASTNLEGRLIEVNPAFTELLGYSRRELLEMRVDDITHPEDREDTRRHFLSLVQGGVNRCEVQKRYQKKSGEVIHVRAGAGLVRDMAGQPMSIVIEVEDETERLRSEREIQRMRSYLKNIIDSMPSLLIGVDVEGRITEWNRSAEQNTGIPSGEAVGRDFTELLPQLAEQMQNVGEAIRRRRPIGTERMPLKWDGENRYAQVMVYPLMANGAVGAVIRMDDITERIRMEQMMVQSEKMVSLGGLAAGMAHEISNPLSIIMQSAQNILRRLTADLPANRNKAAELGLDLEALRGYLEARGVSEFLKGIQEAGSRASRIVTDMLAFSRRSASQSAPVRMEELIETVVRLAASDYDLKKKYDFRQIVIERDFDTKLGEVVCDRNQIEQVFLNLIKNAAHAMAEAHSPEPHRIWLRTRREGDMARIDVEDNGPGMDEMTRKRAFEPFYTTKELGVGTGLGLSVSYFIVVEQHKGSISVTQREGGGSRFTIRLPLAGKEA